MLTLHDDEFARQFAGVLAGARVHGAVTFANTLGVILFIALLVTLWKLWSYRERSRRLALSRVAATLGLQFTPGNLSDDTARQFPSLEATRRRFDGTENHLTGVVAGCPVMVCERYHFSCEGPGFTTGVILVCLPRNLPFLAIDRRRWSDGLLSLMGCKETDVDAPWSFHRRFRVTTKDRDFALRLLIPKMTVFLLRNRRCEWSLRGRSVTLEQRRVFRPKKIPDALQVATEFVRLIPGELWDEFFEVPLGPFGHAPTSYVEA